MFQWMEYHWTMEDFIFSLSVFASLAGLTRTLHPCYLPTCPHVVAIQDTHRHNLVSVFFKDDIYAYGQMREQCLLSSWSSCQASTRRAHMDTSVWMTLKYSTHPARRPVLRSNRHTPLLPSAALALAQPRPQKKQGLVWLTPQSQQPQTSHPPGSLKPCLLLLLWSPPIMILPSFPQTLWILWSLQNKNKLHVC